MIYEFYLLIKHGRFSYSDLLIMPVYERKIMLDHLINEAEKRQERAEQANKNTN
jgi:heme exporter protein D